MIYILAVLGMILIWTGAISLQRISIRIENTNTNRKYQMNRLQTFCYIFTEGAVIVAFFVQGNREIAMGMIIGSCLFQLFCLDGVFALMKEIRINENQVQNNGSFLIVSCIVFLFLGGDYLLQGKYTQNELSRIDGLILICIWLIYEGGKWIREYSQHKLEKSFQREQLLQEKNTEKVDLEEQLLQENNMEKIDLEEQLLQEKNTEKKVQDRTDPKKKNNGREYGLIVLCCILSGFGAILVSKTIPYISIQIKMPQYLAGITWVAILVNIPNIITWLNIVPFTENSVHTKEHTETTQVTHIKEHTGTTQVAYTKEHTGTNQVTNITRSQDDNVLWNMGIKIQLTNLLLLSGMGALFITMRINMDMIYGIILLAIGNILYWINIYKEKKVQHITGSVMITLYIAYLIFL